METDEDDGVRWVVEHKLSRLADKVEKLNRRGAKLGCEPFVVVPTGDTRECEDRDDVTGFVYRRWTEHGVTVEGGLPQLPGYTLAAVLQHTPEGNLVTAPGYSEDNPAPEAWRTLEPDCEHCGLDRSRATTIIAIDDEGHERQIGKSCAKDFFGWHGDPVRWAELLNEARGAVSEDDPDLGPTDPDPKSLVALASALIRAHGFGAASSDVPTKHDMGSVVYGPEKQRRRVLEDVDFLDSDEDVYDLVLDWCEHQTGDFAWNAGVALRLPSLDARKFGLIAAAVHVATGNAAEDKARREAEALRQANAEPVPVTSERLTITGVILSTKTVHNDFGSTVKLLVVDDRGFKVWGSRPRSLDAYHSYEVDADFERIRGDDGHFIPIDRPAATVGDRITFAAKVEVSEDDPKFGFYKRPTKAKLLTDDEERP